MATALANLNTLFNYLPNIRKTIYTTNTIKLLNSVVGKATKKRRCPSPSGSDVWDYRSGPKKMGDPNKEPETGVKSLMIGIEEQLIPHI